MYSEIGNIGYDKHKKRELVMVLRGMVNFESAFSLCESNSIHIVYPFQDDYLAFEVHTDLYILEHWKKPMP